MITLYLLHSLLRGIQEWIAATWPITVANTINSKRPEVSVRCVAVIRPESGVKPTYQGHCSTDAIDRSRLLLARRDRGVIFRICPARPFRNEAKDRFR